MDNFNKILIIDDEIDICKQLSGLLNDLGYNSSYSNTAEEGIELFRTKNFSLVLLDILLNNSKFDGFQTLEKIKNINQDIPVIMISGHGNIETAVNSIKQGAYDFVEKPFDGDIIVFKIKKALETLFLKRKLSNFQKLKSNLDLVKKSQSSKELDDFINFNAKNDNNILLKGDTGSGKQFVASIIHNRSYRVNKNFKIINCNKRKEDFENEFFGKEENKIIEIPGLLEEVNYGTLYLKNIDLISTSTQGKLLRILEERKYYRIGSFSPISLNLRIIASSHKNFDDLNKIIRKELLKQLNFTQINIPTLEDRPDDFDDLLKIFIKQSFEKRNINNQQLSNDLIENLKEVGTFSNFLQLEKFIDWLVIMFEKSNIDIISKEIFEKLIIKICNLNQNTFDTDGDQLFNLKIKDARDIFEKKFLIYNLRKFKYNVSLLSSKIGMERTALYRKIKSMNIKMDIE
ncbi:MAG: sigma-54-dependent transcriptional regulator [Alphaproteobacteria bacterium]